MNVVGICTLISFHKPLKSMHFSTLLAASVSLTFLSAIPCYGGVNVTIAEESGNLVLSYSGTIDLSATLSVYDSSASLPVSGGVLKPSFGLFYGGEPSSPMSMYSVSFTGPATISSGTSSYASTGSGDAFGIYTNGPYLILPRTYSSGASLNGSTTFNGKPLSDFALTAGPTTGP
jgi:hypothetical protein